MSLYEMNKVSPSDLEGRSNNSEPYNLFIVAKLNHSTNSTQFPLLVKCMHVRLKFRSNLVNQPIQQCILKNEIMKCKILVPKDQRFMTCPPTYVVERFNNMHEIHAIFLAAFNMK